VAKIYNICFHHHVDVDVADVLAQAERLYASVSNNTTDEA